MPDVHINPVDPDSPPKDEIILPSEEEVRARLRKKVDKRGMRRDRTPDIGLRKRDPEAHQRSPIDRRRIGRAERDNEEDLKEARKEKLPNPTATPTPAASSHEPMPSQEPLLPIADPDEISDSDKTQEYEDDEISDLYFSMPDVVKDVDNLVEYLAEAYRHRIRKLPTPQKSKAPWTARTQQRLAMERRHYLQYERYLEEPVNQDDEESVELEFEPEMTKLISNEPIAEDQVYVVKLKGSASNDQPETSLDKAFDVLSPEEIKTHWKLVENAVRKEVRSWYDLKTFELGHRSKLKNVLDTRWVLRWKLVAGERIVKARLVVRGFKDMQFFEDPGGEKTPFKTYAGTASRWGQRFVVSVAACKGWRLRSADVGTAFLQGVTFAELHELTKEPLREVSFEPPNGFAWAFQELPGMDGLDFTRFAFRMLKPGFGLKDAPRAWRVKLHAVLAELGGTSLRVDPQLYLWRSDGKLTAVVSTHVDDLKMAGEEQVIAYIIQRLEERFGSMKVQEGKFEHCGIVNEQDEFGDIDLHQNPYVDQIKPLEAKHLERHSDETDLQKLKYSVFRTVLGALSWLAQTRYDVAVYVAAMQRVANTPTVGHVRKLAKVVRWVRRKRVSIKYRRLRWPLRVLVVTDSAFRKEDQSGLAMRGAMIGVAEKNQDTPGGGFHLLEVFARKQRRVTRSTYGAELLALSDGIEFAKLMAIAFDELVVPNATLTELIEREEKGLWKIQVEAVTDARSVRESVMNADYKVPKEDSLILTLLQLREAVVAGRVSKLWWCETSDMISDGLTKGAVSRNGIVQVCVTGSWQLQHAAICT